MQLFLVVAPGLEAVAAREAEARLGVAVRQVAGGVELAGEAQTLLDANLRLAIPSKVLVRVGQVTATSFEALRRQVAALPWASWLPRQVTVKVKASARKCRLYHTGGIAERVSGALADAGLVSGTSLAPVELLVRGEHDRFTLSFDASGELLYRRGFRTDTGPASLRETLAAGLLALAGWDPAREALCDPMCGAGTIAIEAAARGMGLDPGRGRSFACETWPIMSGACRESSPARPLARPVLASDREPRAITWTRANAERAGVTVETRVGDAASLALPEGPGLILANPPYGRRLEGAGQALRALLELQRRHPGWRLAALGLPGLRGDRHPVDNGGLELELVVAK